MLPTSCLAAILEWSPGSSAHLKIRYQFRYFFLLKVPEKKGTLRKDHKPPESTEGSKEKSTWKAETAQVRTDLRQESVQL